MTRDTLPDRELAQLLDAQIEAMTSMLAALEAERAALSARDSEALLDAVNGKARHLADAGALEQRRRAILDRLGIPPQGCHRAFSADAGVASRWQRVVALTERCRALNEANGQHIRSQHRHIDGALRVLHGQPAAPAEYGPAGARRARGTGRLLGFY